ncbi:hypothetical protein SAMN05444413_111104 [Roseivivax marinus]|uniref:hypothetical protein n=1 Tax=Roseivivax marinus TaxID=1379903 RepID=UPI0008B5E8C4|nr:hypothetical protein [Roseivivax marinus]SEL59392.1 hypothetical protein SAMN05444413_111104 [Roseivivax marinus]
MPKTPTKTDAEIRTAILAFRDQHGEWPTYNQVREILEGPAGNDRLARISRSVKIDVEQRPGTATAQELEAAIVAGIHAELNVTEEPLLVLKDIRRRVIEALETAERQCLEREVGRRRVMQDQLRSVDGILDSLRKGIEAGKTRARGA